MSNTHLVALPKVVHKVGHVKQVERREGLHAPLPCGVIVVPVDAEDGQPYRKVGVLVVHVPKPVQN